MEKLISNKEKKQKIRSIIGLYKREAKRYNEEYNRIQKDKDIKLKEKKEKLKVLYSLNLIMNNVSGKVKKMLKEDFTEEQMDKYINNQIKRVNEFYTYYNDNVIEDKKEDKENGEEYNKEPSTSN